MSVLHRTRAGLLVCCVGLVAALGAFVLAPAAGASKLGSTYLALGDSLAYGFHQAQFEEEVAKGTGTCVAGKCIEPATFDEGYVDDFAHALKLANPKLQVVNVGCPGETTTMMIGGSGIEGVCGVSPTGFPWPAAWLHHLYLTPQLSDAVSILEHNPNVSPITLDIGADDVLQFLRSTCGFPKTDTCSEAEVINEFGTIAGNVHTILTKLHEVAPSAQIVLIGVYNPFPTVLPSPGGDKSTAGLNAALASIASEVPGVSFANPEPLFNPSIITGGPESEDIPTICAFTGMCPGGTFNPASPKADIHPTKLG